MIRPWNWVIRNIDNSRYLPQFVIVFVGAFLWLSIDRQWLVNQKKIDVIIWTVGVIWILWQYYANHRQTLKVQIYEKISESVVDVKKKIAILQSKSQISEPAIFNVEKVVHGLLGIIAHFKKLSINNTYMNGDISKINNSVNDIVEGIGNNLSDLLKSNQDVQDAISNMVYVIESYHIAIPRFNAIAREINIESAQVVNAFINYHGALSVFYGLMQEVAYDSNEANYQVREDIIRNIECKRAELNKSIGDLSVYVYKLENDAQNELFGKLFRDVVA